MTHRAESVVQAVVAKVTGLTATGARVYRGRVYPVQAGELPCLLVYMGGDEIVARMSNALIDSSLTIYVEALTRSASSQIDTLLNTIREQVTIALAADHTQGLGYVIDSIEGDTPQPELSGEGEQIAGSLRMEWKFIYRRSRTNPGA